MKKYNIILNIIGIGGSVFMFAGYLCYFIKQFIFSEGVLPFCIALFVILLLPALILLDGFGLAKRMLKRAYTAVKSVYCFALLFYTVTFIALCIYIEASSLSAPEPESLDSDTVFVTLGAKVNADGEPGAVLRKRLNRTVEYLLEVKGSRVIVCGGRGDNEPISEAESMKNYLIRAGISADRIILEGSSTDTVENIENAAALLGEEISSVKLVFITTNFHIPRVRILCSRLGVNAYGFVGSPDSSAFLHYTTLVREYMSYCKLILLGT